MVHLKKEICKGIKKIYKTCGITNERQVCGLMATKKLKKDKIRGLTERQKNIIRLREKLNAPDPNAVNPFTKYKIITYICNLACPPYAIYRIWGKKSEFSKSEKGVQSMVCILYMIILITILFGG